MVAARTRGVIAGALLLMGFATQAGTIDQRAHRLTRAEYADAIREILDLPIDVAHLLPADDAPDDSRDLQPAYRSAAGEVSRIAMGRAIDRRQATFRIPADDAQDRHVERLPFGTRGGTAIHHVFPADGHYDISTFAVMHDDQGTLRPFGDTQGEQLEVSIDGERAQLFDWDSSFTGTDAASRTLDVRVPVEAGAHTVTVTFLARHYAPSLDLNAPLDRSPVETGGLPGYTFPPHIDSVRIDGPFDGQLAATLSSRRRLLVCEPAKPRDQKNCARRIILDLAERAYRAKPTRADRKALLAAYDTGARRDGFESGIEAVVERVLTDPKFLHRPAAALPSTTLAEDVDDPTPRGADASVPNRQGATPLAIAAAAGNAALVRVLLQAGAKVDAGLPHGETPLMLAAHFGSVDAVHVLLEAGADVDAKETLRGTTALMWAAAASQAPAVAALIDAGADVAATSSHATLGRSPYLADTAVQRLDAGRTGIAPRPASLPAPERGGGLTAHAFAARQGDIESAKLLLKAGANVNQQTRYGWSPLLTAVHNRNYRLASLLLDAGADPNLANQGGWTALYIATDNRNIEGGDIPTRPPDLDHLEMIRRLLARGANVNARMRSSTQTRTMRAQQWLHEEGATPLLRAAQSGDVELVKLLLSKGADPKINTELGVTPLMVAAGVGWVEGITHEWSKQSTLETMRLLIARGVDVNARDRGDGRTALMAAAYRGNDEAVKLLIAAGARLDTRDLGSVDSVGDLAGRTWQAIDYAEGRVRVGVQSAIAHPSTAALIRRMSGGR